MRPPTQVREKTTSHVDDSLRVGKQDVWWVTYANMLSGSFMLLHTGLFGSPRAVKDLSLQGNRTEFASEDVDEW